MSKSFHAAVIVLLAALSVLVHAHFLLTLPPMLNPAEFQGAFVVHLALGANDAQYPAGAAYARFTLILASITGVLAAALALAIALRTRMSPATRRLALCLATASWATAYFFILLAHPIYVEALGLRFGNPWRIAMDALSYLAAVAAPWLFLRFFIGYPRQPTPQDWRNHFARLRSEAGEAMHRGWRRWLYPRSMRQVSTDRDLFGGPAAMLQRLDSPWPVLPLALISLTLALADVHAAKGVNAILWGLTLMLAMMPPFALAAEALRYHMRNAVADDRLRIEWIFGTVFIGGILLLAVPFLWWPIVWISQTRFEAMGLVAPGVVIIGPSITALQLFVLAILLSLALSIFYRGTVDPRLAIGKLTVLGGLSFIFAFLFLLLERTVAIRLALWLEMPPETGLVFAAGLATATFAPVRKHGEAALNRLVLRYLPLDSLVQGQRQSLAVVLADLSGYTALSARDERQAMLAAALLQRTAERGCERHDGRLIKTMGDAVLLAFPNPGAAVRAIGELHKEFAASASTLGVTPLPVHSGAHWGEVTVTENGDVFGQVVNIAARLQSQASPGQAVISYALAEAAKLPPDSGSCLGEIVLKNVPEPVSCLQLALASDADQRPASEAAIALTT